MEEREAQIVSGIIATKPNISFVQGSPLVCPLGLSQLGMPTAGCSASQLGCPLLVEVLSWNPHLLN